MRASTTGPDGQDIPNSLAFAISVHGSETEITLRNPLRQFQLVCANHSFHDILKQHSLSRSFEPLADNGYEQHFTHDIKSVYELV